MKTREFQIDVTDNEILANLLGVFDKNLRVIQVALGIVIKNRGNIFLLSGSAEGLIRGEKIIKDLYINATNENLSEKKIHLLVRKYMGNHEEQGNMEPTPDIKTPRRAIKTQGKNQSIYIVLLHPYHQMLS